MELRGFRDIAAVACILIFGAAAFGQTDPAKTDGDQGAPVTLDGRTLFVIRTSLGPFSAEDRARAASARLLVAARDLALPPGAVVAAASDASTDIVARDRVLLTITEADARAAQRSRSDLAASHVAAIRSAIASRRAAYSRHGFWMGALYTALATLALIVLYRSASRIVPVLCRKIEANRGARIRSIRIQRAELISADRIAATLIHCLRLLRLAFVAAILYVYVPLVLSFFPWTRDYAPRLFAYVADPLRSAASSLLSYLPNLVVVVVVLIGASALVRAARFVFDHVARGTITWSGFYPEWADPTYKIVRLLIFAFAAVVIFPYLPGSDSPAFRGVSIFLGVLFSLGSTSAVSNIVAGTILTYTRAFQVGDHVKIADTTGDVVEKTLLATRLRTVKNELVTVPNGMVLGGHITNYSARAGNGRGFILHTSVTIGYDAPWRTIHDLLIAAALRTEGILHQPSPFVLQTGLDDFYVSYQINGYTNEPARMMQIYSLLHENIQDTFNEAGMEIMSPHYSALRDGNRKAIPDDYLARDYEAPAFRLTRDGRSSAATGAATGAA